MSTYRIRYNKSSVHIEGFDTATKGGGQDMGDHISYSANSHCPALTRGAYNMGYAKLGVRGADGEVVSVDEWDNPRAVLDAAALYTRVRGGKVCLKCTEAAMRAIDQI